MNLEFGVLNDGRITLVCDSPLPEIVKRVEFYRDQKLFMLVYDKDEKSACEDDNLMECEIPERLLGPIEKNPSVAIFTIFPDLKPLVYDVPLIKVHN